MIPSNLKKILSDFYQTGKRITVLTGAGISAESGIPTFRGPEGYWTVGSKVYQPQEIGTAFMLKRQPEEVWKWFLYRRGICRTAQPNSGHLALVDMEKLFADRFILITQNVDGLHTRAGNSLERTYKIHGDLEFMRCMQECSEEIYPIPEKMPARKRNEPLTPLERDMLKCPKCHDMTRPHVLLWDECYNEPFYRLESSLYVARQTDLLLIVGTSGSTTLPTQIVSWVLHSGGIVIDINITRELFAQRILDRKQGYFIEHPSSQALPAIMQAFREKEKI